MSSRPTEVELNRFYRISIVLTEITSGDARSQRVSGECRHMATKILELHTATYPQISYIPICWHRWRTDRRMDGRSETNIPIPNSLYNNTTVEEWVCCDSLLCVNPGCKSRQLCNIPRRVLQFSYVDGLRNILHNVILRNINKARYINGLLSSRQTEVEWHISYRGFFLLRVNASCKSRQLSNIVITILQLSGVDGLPYIHHNVILTNKNKANILTGSC